MRHGRNVVFDVYLLETEMCNTLGRQGNVVVALGCMTHEEALFLFEVFQRPHEVGIRVGACAFKEFFGKDACLLLLPEEA